MKKNVIIAIIMIVVIIIIGLGIGLMFFKTNKGIWVCENGVWQKQGNPTGAQPASGCGDPINTNQDQVPVGNIVVSFPAFASTVSSPIKLEGQARGLWYFEASAPVRLEDLAGHELARSYIQAQGEWMTENYVPFKGEISYEAATTTNALLIFERDNPSGKPELLEEYRVPVMLMPTRNSQVKIYFNNNNLDPAVTCNKVFSVDRIVPFTQAVARAALDELLTGPTGQEKNDGYFTNINEGVVIQKLTIIDGVAKVDFNEQLESGVGGSCKVSAIRAQITETLKQFPTVNSVIISINGRTEDILQP